MNIAEEVNKMLTNVLSFNSFYVGFIIITHSPLFAAFYFDTTQLDSSNFIIVNMYTEIDNSA